MLLRRIELRQAQLVWQNGGGKGDRPKPIPLPDDKMRTGKPAGRIEGAEAAQRLKNLGLFPAGTDTSD